VSLHPSRDRGAMSAGAIVVVSVAIAAVIGLIAGAVWGQVSRNAASNPSATSAAPATSDSTTPSPTTSSGTPTDSGSPSSSVTPTATGASPTGAAPAAPATTTTSADGWRLGSWKITNTAGTLGVDTTARNTATGTRSATLVLYVYVNGALIATTTAVVTDVAAGATVPVHFAGTDPWQPGTKVLLLATA